MAHSNTQVTPTGVVLHDLSRFTPSGYPYTQSDESDNDLIHNPDDDWTPFQKRKEIEESLPGEQERVKLLLENAENFGTEMAYLTRRERIYLLNALPGRILKKVALIRGWKEEVTEYKEACFHNGRMNIVEKMKRHMARAAKRSKR